MDKDNKSRKDKLSMKKKADKNNPKLKTPQIAGSTTVPVGKSKPKKTY